MCKLLSITDFKISTGKQFVTIKCPITRHPYSYYLTPLMEHFMVTKSEIAKMFWSLPYNITYHRN